MHEQPVVSVNDNISQWEDLTELQAHMVNEGANRADRDAEIQNGPVTDPQQSTVHQEREADKESDSTDAVKANEPNFKDWGDESESNSENDISSSHESDEYTSSSDSDDENSNDLDNNHVLGSEGVQRSADW